MSFKKILYVPKEESNMRKKFFKTLIFNDAQRGTSFVVNAPWEKLITAEEPKSGILVVRQEEWWSYAEFVKMDHHPGNSRTYHGFSYYYGKNFYMTMQAESGMRFKVFEQGDTLLVQYTYS